MKYLLIIFLLTLVSCTLKVPQHYKTNRTLVFTDYGSLAYENGDIKEYIKALKSMKSKKASLLFTCYTQNLTSSNIDCDSYDSPVRSKISKAINKLKNEGFIISLRVYVDLRSHEWRAKWEPTNKEEAFSNLKKVLLDFAIFSDKHKVDNFIIGSEYERLTKPEYSHYWVNIIEEIKKRYHRQIIYAANGNISTFKQAEYQWINFWPHLKSIGINHYPPFNGQPSFKRLLKNHKNYLSKYQKVIKKWKLPVHYTEVGFPISAKGYQKPYTWIWDKKIGKSKKLQLINLKSFLTALKTSKYRSVYFWRHMPRESAVHPQGYIMSDDNTLKLISIELDN